MKKIKTILIAVFIGILAISCEKEEIQKPKELPQQNIIEQEEPIAANVKFLGTWTNGVICGTNTTVSITAGPNDSTIIIHGFVSALVSDSTFNGVAGAVTHYGTLSGEVLQYCQYSANVNCCGQFTK